MYIKKKSSLWIFATISTIFIISILLLTFVFGKSSGNETRGTFGDMFGFANALFTGLSFVGLIVTILLQRQDLKENEENLNKQIYMNYVQNFDNTFFNLLKFLDDKKQSYNDVSSKNNHNGSIFGSMHLAILNDVREIINTKIKATSDDLYNIRPGYEEKLENEAKLITVDEAVFAYNKTFKWHHDFLKLYFSNILSILKFVDLSKVEDKLLYCEILKSQLSHYELLILNYNALANNNAALNQLVLRYGILSNLAPSELINENLLYSGKN